MAAQTFVDSEHQDLRVLVRMAKPERDAMWKLLFNRYPEEEWGTFLRLGWHETSQGLILTINALDIPLAGDLDCNSEIVEIQSNYTKRILRYTEEHPFAVGFVHSHPEDYQTYPSRSDYDMESYYASLLHGYTSSKPFVSLIFSKSGNKFSGSGRVWWKGRWHNVTRFAVEGQSISLYGFKQKSVLSQMALNRVARLASAFSNESAEALARATVSVIGLSGTGSPIVELLARAGVGNLILVDPDVFSDSNLERIHGSEANDIGSDIAKCLLAKRHVLTINPDCKVTVVKGRLPQSEVMDLVLWSDLVFGCTDLYSARVALNDMSLRYAVPVIDVGVTMEGADGAISGQAVQINRLFPSDACVYCRNMIDSRIVSQELMSEDDQDRIRNEARLAGEEGRNPNAYWVDTPQLNTVGYLTTMVGSMASGFGIGYLTERFSMPTNRLELSFNKRGTSIVEQNATPKSSCSCQNMRGVADQIPEATLISPASHWPEPEIFSD